MGTQCLIHCVPIAVATIPNLPRLPAVDCLVGEDLGQFVLNLVQPLTGEDGYVAHEDVGQVIIRLKQELQGIVINLK